MATKVTPPEPEDTQPVIAYRVSQLEDAVKNGFKEQNEKLDKLINNFATKIEFDGLSKRVADLEGDRKWIVRLIVSAVILALLGLLGIGAKTMS